MQLSSLLRPAAGLAALATLCLATPARAQFLLETTKLVAADTAPGDQLGHAVAVSGDTIVLGAPMDDDLGFSSGGAYAFVRSGSTWTEQAKLLASDGTSADRHGWSVAVDGDTAIVGALFADSSAPVSGAVYVYVRTGTTWMEQAKLEAADAGTSDWFCRAIDIDGDTVVVGAPEDNDAGSNSGSAYVFTRSGTTWTQEDKLVGADLNFDDWFGFVVDVSGDTAAVGAYREDEGGGNAGATYVFTRSGTTWTEQQKLVAADGAAGDELGWSVTVSGDRVVSGARNHDGAASDAGAAYFFARDSAGSWTQAAKSEASDAMADDEYGFAVSLDGPTLVVGSYLNDELGGSSGAAYVLDVFDPPVAYCTGKTNSLGCVPFVSFTGVPSVSDTTPFNITMNDSIPNEAGFVIYSFKKANLNFHGGKLCVKTPFTRTPAKSPKNPGGGCSGWILRRNFNATIQSGNDPSLSVGATVRAQWFGRDPLDPFFGDNLSDGLSFTIAP